MFPFSSIPLWGWLDIAFTLSVLLGVIGEMDSVLHWLAGTKPKELTPDELAQKKWKRLAEALLIVGIAGELVCLAYSLRGTAAFEDDAKRAQRETEELRVKFAWRIISEEDCEELRSTLSLSPGSVDIEYPSGDVEASYLATEIMNVFSAAKWNIRSMGAASGALAFGLIIPDSTNSDVNTVRFAFRSIFFPFTAEAIPTGFTGTYSGPASPGTPENGVIPVLIFVGSKPPPKG